MMTTNETTTTTRLGNDLWEVRRGNRSRFILCLIVDGMGWEGRYQVSQRSVETFGSMVCHNLRSAISGAEADMKRFEGHDVAVLG